MVTACRPCQFGIPAPGGLNSLLIAGLSGRAVHARFRLTSRYSAVHFAEKSIKDRVRVLGSLDLVTSLVWREGSVGFRKVRCSVSLKGIYT